MISGLVLKYRKGERWVTSAGLGGCCPASSLFVLTKPGDIVITGAPVRSVEVRAGSRLHADYGPLGTIDLEFV
jgi:hypothetical protein